MRRTAGIENNIGTRVERREKGSDRLPPYCCQHVQKSIGHVALLGYESAVSRGDPALAVS